MEKTRKLSIKDESEQEVRQIEKELDDHPELDNIQVTKEMDDALFAKIRELEEKEYRKEKQENRISEPEKRYRRKRTKHWYLVLAAVLVLVFAFGSVSVGSKSYWKELLDVIVDTPSTFPAINKHNIVIVPSIDIILFFMLPFPYFSCIFNSLH